MTSKNTFAIFGILAVLLMSLGMVSAKVLTIENTTIIPSTINHGDEITITLNTTYTGASDNVSLTWSDTTLKIGSWTFPTLKFLEQNESQLTTAKLLVPLYASGIINAKLEVAGSGSNYLEFTTEILESSELTITSITSNLSKTTNGTVKVQNTGNVNLTGISLETITTDTADFTIQFNDSDFDLTAGQSKLVKVSSTDVDDLDFRDDNSLKMRATNGSLDSNSLALTIDNSFYDGDNEGRLSVSIDRINVEKGYGDDEEYWYPFDDIELKITIDNNGEWDIENIELQLCLLDVERNKCILDEDDMELDEDDFDIDRKDDNSVLINFNVDPSVLKEGNTDYTLYVSAVGKIDDNECEYYDGDETGASTSQKIEIRTDEEFIIFDQVTLTDSSGYDNKNEISCGTEVTLSANVWNVGDKDLDNDEIFVLVHNKELGISEVVSFNNGINSMDWELLETTFTIPSNAAEKTYTIKLTAYDDEDLDDNDVYENKEDDESKFYQSLKVICKTSITQPTVNANLESEAEIGEELIIKTIITNNDEDNDFIISLSDFEDWATLVSITPQTVSINKGEFAEVTIVLKPTITGKHSFNIDTIVDGETYSQPVSVNIAKESGIFPSISNTILYIITGIVTLLIVIVLIVIVRLSRRRTKPEF